MDEGGFYAAGETWWEGGSGVRRGGVEVGGDGVGERADGTDPGRAEGGRCCGRGAAASVEWCGRGAGGGGVASGELLERLGVEGDLGRGLEEAGLHMTISPRIQMPVPSLPWAYVRRIPDVLHL